MLDTGLRRYDGWQWWRFQFLWLCTCGLGQDLFTLTLSLRERGHSHPCKLVAGGGFSGLFFEAGLAGPFTVEVVLDVEVEDSEALDLHLDGIAVV